MGSLCLLSKSPKPPMSLTQRARLVKFSNAIVHAIASRSRLVRQDLQKKRIRLLSDLTAEPSDASTAIERSLDLLRKTFKGCGATYQRSVNGHLALPGEGEVACSAFQQDLWENSDLINLHIYKKNQAHMPSDRLRTIRAIACKTDDAHYLVVTAPSLRIVLDDEGDVLFIRSVAMMLAKQQQDELLKEAINSKESFLRDVQHSLRTSLNGILSASEMLLDEAGASEVALAVRRASNEQLAPKSGSQKDLLTIIDSSGRGLLAIINNLLRFQTAETLSPKLEMCSLSDLEEDVITSTIQGSSMERLSRVTIVAENRIPDNIDIMMIDRAILRQIMAIMLQNAVEATDDGSIEIMFDQDPSGTLILDVTDTGRGLAEVRRIMVYGKRHLG